MRIYLLLLLIVILIAIFNEHRYKIPKIAWSYWDTNTPPIVTTIIEQRRRAMPDWKIHLLTEKDIGNYIDISQVPKGYDKLGKPHKADWIRLKLLEKYGGLWLDASLIVNKGLAINEIRDEAINSRANLVAFTLNKPKPEDFIENWFIMAPQKSLMIKLWLREFEKAISIGFANYRAQVLLHDIMISKGIYNEKEDNVYLTQHACMQMVLKRHLHVPVKILLYPAERNMYKVQTDCKWKYECIINTVSNDPAVRDLPFIKLRGGEKTINYKKYFQLN